MLWSYYRTLYIQRLTTPATATKAYYPVCCVSVNLLLWCQAVPPHTPIPHPRGKIYDLTATSGSQPLLSLSLSPVFWGTTHFIRARRAWGGQLTPSNPTPHWFLTPTGLRVIEIYVEHCAILAKGYTKQRESGISGESMTVYS